MNDDVMHHLFQTVSLGPFGNMRLAQDVDYGAISTSKMTGEHVATTTCNINEGTRIIGLRVRGWGYMPVPGTPWGLFDFYSKITNHAESDSYRGRYNITNPGLIQLTTNF